MEEYLLHEEHGKPVQGKMERNLSKPWGCTRNGHGVLLIFRPTYGPGGHCISTQTPERVCLASRGANNHQSPEVCPAYGEDSHLPGQTYGALDGTAELLAKLLCGCEDPDVTALCEAVRAKLGITEPLPKPALTSPSPESSTLADDYKRSRVSRLLPKVTGHSPFHPRARTVPIPELQDVPVTDTEKKRLTALGPLAGRPPFPSDPTSRGGKSGKPIAQANILLELPGFDPHKLPEWAEQFAQFLLLTGRSHLDVATKCSPLNRSCKRKFLQKKAKQIVKTCST